jgi:hypothetical protein
LGTKKEKKVACPTVSTRAPPRQSQSSIEADKIAAYLEEWDLEVGAFANALLQNTVLTIEDHGTVATINCQEQTTGTLMSSAHARTLISTLLHRVHAPS